MPARRASARVARLVRSAAAAVRAVPLCSQLCRQLCKISSSLCSQLRSQLCSQTLPLARPRVVARRSFAEC